MKKKSAVGICIFLAFALSFIACHVQSTDYYDSYGTKYFFNRCNPYCFADYALVECDCFGGEFEDTDFSAATFVLGSNVYNLTKVACISVDFYDNDCEHTRGAGCIHVPYCVDSMQSVSIYGADYVNNEYGLDTFTSIHTIYFYDSRYVDESGNPIAFDYMTIYVDTTGNY